MTTIGHKRILLTGGTANALDGINGSGLSEDDFAFVMVNGELYQYNYKNYGSAQTEASPDIIVPDSNPGNFAWQLQIPASYTIIDANTTLYLATTGNDSTGDGSSGTPWYSLEKVFDYLKDKWIQSTVTVTVSIGDGTYTGLNSVMIKHPCSSSIIIDGAVMATTILTFISGGLVLRGNSLQLIDNITLKGSDTGISYGIALYSAKILALTNVKFDTWGFCVRAMQNSYASLDTCDFYNFENGVLAKDKSKIDLDTCDFDANSVPISTGVNSLSSTIIISTTTTFSNVTIGCHANINSFIDATGVTSNTATTPYSPTPTTSSSAEPTWGNWGSWIKD